MYYILQYTVVIFNVVLQPGTQCNPNPRAGMASKEPKLVWYDNTGQAVNPFICFVKQVDAAQAEPLDRSLLT